MNLVFLCSTKLCPLYLLVPDIVVWTTKMQTIKNVWLRYHNNYLHWSSKKKNLPQKENWRQREYTWCTACQGAHVQATLCSHGWLITNESLITPRLVTLCHLSQYKHKQQPSLPLPPVAHISHVNRLEFYCLIVTFLLFVYTQPPHMEWLLVALNVSLATAVRHSSGVRQCRFKLFY